MPEKIDNLPAMIADDYEAYFESDGMSDQEVCNNLLNDPSPMGLLEISSYFPGGYRPVEKKN